MPSRVNIDARVSRLLADSREQHAELAKSLLESQQRKYMYPPDFPGDPDDDSAIAAAFDRLTLNQDVVQSYTTDDGVSGDFTLGVVQIEILAQAERAFRARHVSRIKIMLDAAMRHKAHGNNTGIFGRVYPNYLDALKRAASAGRPA
jgi:hypothetical protein